MDLKETLRIEVEQVANGYLVQTITYSSHTAPRFFSLPNPVIDYCVRAMRDWRDEEIQNEMPEGRE